MWNSRKSMEAEQKILDDFYGAKLRHLCTVWNGNARIKQGETEKLNTLVDELQND